MNTFGEEDAEIFFHGDRKFPGDVASQNLEFEKAADLRDEIEEIKTKYKL